MRVCVLVNSSKHPLWPTAPFPIHLVDLPSSLPLIQSRTPWNICIFLCLCSKNVSDELHLLGAETHCASYLQSFNHCTCRFVLTDIWCIRELKYLKENLTLKTDSTYFTSLPLNSWFVSISELLGKCPRILTLCYVKGVTNESN